MRRSRSSAILRRNCSSFNYHKIAIPKDTFPYGLDCAIHCLAMATLHPIQINNYTCKPIDVPTRNQFHLQRNFEIVYDSSKKKQKYQFSNSLKFRSYLIAFIRMNGDGK